MNLCIHCFIMLKTCARTREFSISSHLNERIMSLFKADHYNLLKEQPKFNENLKSLKIAIIGSPNAGKSLLTNQLVAWKFAPVSSKVHTTRAKMIGVHTEGENQIIFMDTPGVIQPSSLKKHNLERSLLVDPHAALFDSHLIAVVVDVSHIWNRMRLDKNILQLLDYHKNKPSILILNKVDLLRRKHELLDVTRRLTNSCINGLPYIKTPSKFLTSDEIIDKFKSSNSNNYKSEQIEKFVDNEKTQENIANNNNCNKSNIKTIIVNNSTDEIKNIIEKNILIDNSINDKKDISKSSLNINSDILNPISDICLTRHNDFQNIDKTFNEQNININNTSDFYDSVKWNHYYSMLKKLSSKHENGWPNFCEVFMVSALTGDGIFELKNYLSSKTIKSKWEYNDSVVTNVKPLELAKLCVREKLIDHVPNDVAHSVEIRKIIWEISDDNLLIARFDIICKRKRQVSLIMGSRGLTIQQISREAKQSLMNAFRREMTLQLIVKYYEDKN